MEESSVCACAPARVNLIGEHTDYNDGLVLPSCTALFTRITARPRAGSEISVRSAMMADAQTFDPAAVQSADASGWIAYVQGVAAGLQDAGVRLRGAELHIDSDIPLGAGLSSSASLELSVAYVLLGMAGETMPASDIALLCQQAEHEYAGVQCGIMDQYALACAHAGNALLLDCRSLETQQVPLPGDIAFILTDSGVRHTLTDGGYNNRADECAAAVASLSQSIPGLMSLRDLSADLLETHRAQLDEVLYRRCRHVISENRRVRAMVAALQSNDLHNVGAILNECHASLRDDYAVSCAEIDALVECANASEWVLGSRMIGGGFGGCVLSVCAKSAATAAAAHISSAYAAISGTQPWQHRVTPAHPAGLVEKK